MKKIISTLFLFLVAGLLFFGASCGSSTEKKAAEADSAFVENVDEAPKPTNTDVYLQKLPFKKVAVITYSGYSNKGTEQQNLVTLGNFLTKNNMKFNTEFYFTAGYDSPFKFLFRHNEVWVELN